MKKRRITMLMVGLAIAATVNAQEEPKLTAKPSGRILFDAAYINAKEQDGELKSGVGIPDMRVGVGFTYSNVSPSSILANVPKRLSARAAIVCLLFLFIVLVLF